MPRTIVVVPVLLGACMARDVWSNVDIEVSMSCVRIGCVYVTISSGLSVARPEGWYFGGHYPCSLQHLTSNPASWTTQLVHKSISQIARHGVKVDPFHFVPGYRSIDPGDYRLITIHKRYCLVGDLVHHGGKLL